MAMYFIDGTGQTVNQTHDYILTTQWRLKYGGHAEQSSLVRELGTVHHNIYDKTQRISDTPQHLNHEAQ